MIEVWSLAVDDGDKHDQIPVMVVGTQAELFDLIREHYDSENEFADVPNALLPDKLGVDLSIDSHHVTVPENDVFTAAVTDEDGDTAILVHRTKTGLARALLDNYDMDKQFTGELSDTEALLAFLTTQGLSVVIDFYAIGD